MENISISIIIPVYNAEKYLPECLNSVAEQTFKNIEVLCVDNDSKDSSPEIIKNFTQKYKNFRYLYKKGGMAGGARNEGLKYSKGKYILFLDSDDKLISNACQILYDTAQNNDADIVSSSFTLFNDSGSILGTYDGTHINNLLSKYKITPSRLLYIGAGIIGRPWGNLIKKSLIEKNALYFPEGLSAEDVPFMGALFAFAGKVIFLNQPLTLYRDTKNSLSKSNKTNSAKSDFTNYIPIREILKKHKIYEQVCEQFEYILLKQIIGGESIGNGRLKQSDLKQTKDFFTLCKHWYLSLPEDFFNKRNAVFKFKFLLFKFALRHNLYFMPKAVRIIVNPFIFIHKLFFKQTELF